MSASRVVGPYRVSAIVSTYNAERLLPACLEDLETQTIAGQIEIIVVDSGSEQHERAIVEDFQRRYGNIVYLRTRRETLYASWNRALRIARGAYITNANTDDAHRQDALERLAAALDAYPQADLAYDDYAWTSVPNVTFADPHIFRLIRHPPFHPAQSMFFCLGGCHPMWRRRVFDRLGRFDPTFKVIGDYEFLMRFAAAGLQAVHVPEVLTLFYQNPRGLTFTNDWRDRELSRLYPAYRERTPIHKLYAVNPRSKTDVAGAWVALGNIAMCCRVPWLDQPIWDWSYAQFCYRRALDSDPRADAALHNLAVLLALQGGPKPLPRLLARLPADLRSILRDALRRGRPRLMAVEVPPALKSLRFGGPPEREIEWEASARGSRSTSSRGATGQAGFVELTHLPAACRNAARHLAAAGRPTRSRIALPGARDRGRLRPRLAPGLDVKRRQDGIVIRDGDRVHYLNGTAALILELCTGRNSWDEIVELVRLAYGLKMRPGSPVTRVLRELLAEGVIRVSRAADSAKRPARSRNDVRR